MIRIGLFFNLTNLTVELEFKTMGGKFK